MMVFFWSSCYSYSVTLLQFHAALGNAVLLFSLAIGLYGLFLYIRKQTISSGFWGTLAIGELLYLSQIAVGLILIVQGDRPGRGVHILYGILPVITLPAAYAFTNGREDHRAAFMYGLIGLFLAGVSIRAITTA